MFFSQLPAVEKDTEKCVPGKFLGPSYFETTLVKLRQFDHRIFTVSSHLKSQMFHFRKSKKGFKSRLENVKVVKLSSYTATINTLRLPIYVVGKQITRSCNFGTWKSNKWQRLLTQSRSKHPNPHEFLRLRTLKHADLKSATIRSAKNLFSGFQFKNEKMEY